MSAVDRRKTESGFSLVEVLVALFLIGIGVLAAAPMFIYAMQGNSVGADFGTGGALAVERMELLRAEAYVDLPAGGSLTSNVANYFDNSDPDYIVRWTIVDNASPSGTRTITVRAIANTAHVGRNKQVTLTTVRGR